MDADLLALERIEAESVAELHAAAPEAVRRRLGLRQECIGSALISIAGAEPSILLNRCIGLGIEAPVERATIAQVIDCYRRAEVGRFFLHLHPGAAPTELRLWLTEAGLAPGRGWMKFKRLAVPPPETASELTVREIGPEHAADFGRIVAPAFDLSAAAEPLLAALVGRPGWHLYMSFAGETPAGTGALFVRDGIGWLDWGSTAPAFRRRGGQGAVLAARIRHAIDLGCRLIGTETGEEVPGDPQHSYHNILKVGFEPTEVRENFAPTRAEAS